MNFALRSVIIATSIFALTAFTFLNLNWDINPNYVIKFSGRGATGTFTGLKGTVNFNPSNLVGSKIDVSVDATTINTGNKKKDEHARNEAWFDVAKFPTIKFTSSAFTKTADAYSAHGTLNLHGVQKEVDIPFTFTNNTFMGIFKVSRKDYGIKGSGPSFMVSSDFEINLNVPVTKK